MDYQLISKYFKMSPIVDANGAPVIDNATGDGAFKVAQLLSNKGLSV